MGVPKALLPLGSRPAVRICAEALLGGGAAEVIVVTGSEALAIEQALSGLPVRFARNEAKGSQMADSVRIGLREISSTSSAVLVSLSDHPLVAESTIRTLIQSHDAHPGKIIIPAFQGRNGHPSLFPAGVLKEIFTAETLRDIVRKDPARVMTMSVEDEGVILDMDTPEDYERMRKRVS